MEQLEDEKVALLTIPRLMEENLVQEKFRLLPGFVGTKNLHSKHPCVAVEKCPRLADVELCQILDVAGWIDLAETLIQHHRCIHSLFRSRHACYLCGLLSPVGREPYSHSNHFAGGELR